MYTSLVIEGGGSKNIASLGALSFLEQQGLINNLSNYAGTSSGAIICTLLNMGFTSQEIFNVIFNGQVNKTTQSNIWMWFYNILKKYGIHNPHKVNKLITDLFKTKQHPPNITFKQLYQKTNKNLVITGTNITKQKIDYFHHLNTPNMPIIDAIRITMNIPLYFTKIQHNGDYYVDGFLLMNFPLYYFDEPSGYLCCDSTELDNHFQTTTPNNQTIGIITIDPDETLDNSNLQINNLSDYLTAILNTMLNNIQQHYLKNNFSQRTIVIQLPLKINPTDFQPPQNTQKQLLQIGFDTAHKFCS